MRRTSERLVTIAALMLLAPSCKKKQEPVDDTPSPTRNSATLDVVNTDIGTGLALRVSLAPTSVVWEQSIAIDDDRAVLLGREGDRVFALRTNDRGRTWSSVSTQTQPGARWGVGANGALALVTESGAAPNPGGGPRGNRATPSSARISEAATFYASADDKSLDGPRPFLPDEGPLKGATLPPGLGRPTLLGSSMSLLVERAGAPTLAYLPFGGGGPVQAHPIERRGGIVPVAYGRPPKLLTVGGGSVEVQDWPSAGQPLGVASPIPNYRPDGDAWTEFAGGPSCEAGAFSFKRLGRSQPWLVGVSGERSLAFRLPASEVATIGCGPDAIVTETSTIDPSDLEKKRKVPQLVRCSLDGKCVEPLAPPFSIWTEKHERRIWAVPTAKGLVAVMRARSGSRWGLYLGQSTEGGRTFELPRTIGEGADSRRLLDFGALLRFQDRIVLLLSADVGTSGRRGWYALASDDQGNSWGPP